MDATSKEQEQQEHQLTNTNTSIDNVTLADFTARAGAVPTPLSPQQYPSSLQVATGKQKAVEETLEPDKAAQKQEKIIKNRESAKSRESKKAVEEKLELDKAALPKQKGTVNRSEYFAIYREQKKARVTEIESTAKDLEKEYERLLVQAERLKKFKELVKIYNPNMDHRRQLRRTNSCFFLPVHAKHL